MSLKCVVTRSLSASALLSLVAGSAIAQPCVDGAAADQTFSITATNRAAAFVSVAGLTDQVAVGDVNNDGFDDVIVGFGDAVFGDVGAVSRRGLVRVFSGQDGSILREFTGNTWTTFQQIDGFGWRVGSADVNGDGFDDVLVGVRRVNGGDGRIDAFSGATGSLLYSINGFGADFGDNIIDLGDITGDGRDDILVSIPGFNPQGGDVPPGAVTVHNGANGALLDNTVGGGLNPRLGRVVGVGPDANDDGVNEVIVATNQSVLLFDPNDLSEGLWIRLVDQFGGQDFAAATVGDLNTDGVDDIAIIVNGEYSVLSGLTGQPVLSDGPEIFAPGGEATALPFDDINGDGVSDLVVAVRGPNGASEDVLYLDAATGDTLARRRSPVVFDPNVSNDETGYAAGIAVGDVNNDGVSDAVVTRLTNMFLATPITETLTAYVYTGAPCAGDVNGDNIVNFSDLNSVLASFGQTGSGIVGDGDCSGATDFADLNTVLSAFGELCD